MSGDTEGRKSRAQSSCSATHERRADNSTDFERTPQLAVSILQGSVAITTDACQEQMVNSRGSAPSGAWSGIEHTKHSAVWWHYTFLRRQRWLAPSAAEAHAAAPSLASVAVHAGGGQHVQDARDVLDMMPSPRVLPVTAARPCPVCCAAV